MPWREQLRIWQQVASGRLRMAWNRFRARDSGPASAGEDGGDLNLGELLDAQVSGRQGLTSAFDEALTPNTLPGGDVRFYRRKDQLDQLCGALDTWLTGHPCMIACFGVHGSGISTLLNQVGQLVRPDVEIRQHNLQQRMNSVEDVLSLCGELFDLAQPPASTEEALTLVRLASRRILVIDNANHLSLRIADNAVVVRTLGMLMVSSRDQHLWMLGCNEEAWRRLVYVHGVDRYFTDLIPLKPFDGEEIANMLAQRLKLAYVQLASETDEPGKAESDPGLPGELLTRLSNGNPRLAIALLIKSLVPSEDPNRFTLSLPQALSTKALDVLLPPALFALAEIAAHGTLNALEHQAIFRCPMIDSRLLLADLYNRRMLCKEPCPQTGGETYCLQPVVAPLITAYLHRKNLLY